MYNVIGVPSIGDLAECRHLGADEEARVRRVAGPLLAGEGSDGRCEAGALRYGRLRPPSRRARHLAKVGAL